MTRRLARLVVRLAARLVPRAERTRFREEWLGELDAGAPRPLRRALGAPADAWAIWRIARGPAWRIGWGADLRDAARALRHAPLQTAVVITCLAIGSTLTVLMFGVVNALVGGSLPGIRDGGQLARIWVERRTDHRVTGLSMGQYRAMATGVPTNPLPDVAAEEPWHFSVAANGQALAANGTFVSGSYFATLGTRARLGRLLVPDDDRPEATPVVVISDGFWRRVFARRPDALGSLVHVGMGAYRIVGVAPAGFTGLVMGDLNQTVDERSDLWIPMAQMWVYADYAAARVDQAVGPRLVARLPDGLSLAEGEARAQALAAVLNASPGPAVAAVRLTPFHLLPTDSAAATAAVVAVLMGVPLLVLAIACANVAGVQLARAVSRTHELAVRVSLGASRWRVARLLLIETGLVAAAAAGVAWTTARTSLSYAANLLPFAVEADARVLAFSVLLPVSVTAIAGFLPAWRGTGFDVQSGLRLGGRVGRTASPALRRGVVIGQVALSLALLATATVLARALRAVPETIGAARTDVLTVEMRFGDLGWTAARRLDAAEGIVERLSRLPGVEAAAASPSPLFWAGDATCWAAVDKPSVTPWELHLAKLVTPDYFRVLGIATRQGRTFASDEAGSVVVNRAFLAELPEPDHPIGRLIRVQRGQSPSAVARIVAVVDDSYERFPRGTPVPQCYLPIGGPTDAQALTVYLCSRDAADLAPAAAQVLAAVDPRLSPSAIGTIAGRLATSYRGLMWLSDALMVISAAAVFLTAVGLFGVIAYTASQRSHEFGVRLALGARPADVAGIVVRESLLVTGAGALAGLALAIPATTFVRQAFLSGVTWRDPVPVAIVLGVLGAISIMATIVPIRRVTAVDPTAALKAE